MLELYANIRKFRRERKMSQGDLAKLVGYTDRSSIAKIENGDVDLPQSKILLIADALGVDAGTLMGNTGISASNARTLSSDESDLLEDYGKLNREGRKRALEAVSELTEIKRYREDTRSSKSSKEGIAG